MAGYVTDDIKEHFMHQIVQPDAFQYFAHVKSRYYCEPHIYKYFVGIVNEYKHGRIGLVGLITRIRILFEDHPDLVEKFNKFLPPGHHISPLPPPSTFNNSNPAPMPPSEQ